MKKKVTEFPFKSARRITPEEVSAARDAVKEQFNIELPKRDRSSKDKDDRYKPISIRLHPHVMEWVIQEAEAQGVEYQTVINDALLKIAR